MASKDSRSSKKRKHNKLPPLPSGAKVQKRPLFRAAIPSPYAGASNPKVVYIRQSTPFMSAVNRVRKLLKQVDNRAMQSASNKGRQGPRNRQLATAGAGLDAAKKEIVTVIGSGRCIEQVVNLASWFIQHQSAEGVNVKMKTLSLTAIDDIEYEEMNEQSPDQDVDGDSQEADDSTELPSTRLRKLSALEVQISLR
ncbi:hypothetical protein BT63DRAFT_409579 [Microthyrium microscopicum]|uniref:Uncharacterized protein n=1 Tax=Microthyrium microscopicum TaxID=703497 RepID=A0A6A6UWQ1_9PEZI|nr:hypothetical protein BT63DRAFT_409579 [Microthyrium microscopicum]